MFYLVKVAGDEYVSSSPDEKAILECCRENGFVFLGDQTDHNFVSRLIEDVTKLQDFNKKRFCPIMKMNLDS